MKLVYKNPVELGKILSAVSVIVNEVNLNFNEDGLSIFGLDSSHVSMIFMNLEKEDCMEYECDEPIKLGINLKTLTSILNTGKDNDIVIIENIGVDALNIVVKNESRKIEYEIKLMEIIMDELEIPEMEYKVKLETTANYFYGLLESIIVVMGQEVNFSVNNGKMVISGSGQLGNTRVELGDGKEYKLECGEEGVEQKFALVFIMKSKKIGEISKNVEVMLDNEAPIQIKYRVGGRSSMKFLLAPKIED
jgi:proliferating cell nuclear antigen